MLSWKEKGLKKLHCSALRFRPEAVAQCLVNLIEDDSAKTGQVVKVTPEDGVEYLSFDEVRR